MERGEVPSSKGSLGKRLSQVLILKSDFAARGVSWRLQRLGQRGGSMTMPMDEQLSLITTLETADHVYLDIQGKRVGLGHDMIEEIVRLMHKGLALEIDVSRYNPDDTTRTDLN